MSKVASVVSTISLRPQVATVQRPSPRGAPPATLAAPPRLEAPTRGAGGAWRWRHGAARAGLTAKCRELPICTQPRITRLRGAVQAHNARHSTVRPARAAPCRPPGCIDCVERRISAAPRLKKENQPGGLNPGNQPWGAKRVWPNLPSLRTWCAYGVAWNLLVQSGQRTLFCPYRMA